MATLRVRERADGTRAWSVLFRHDGRQSSVTFDTQRAAERFQRDLDRLGPSTALDILDGTMTEADILPTVTDAATAYIDALTGVSEYTIKRYRTLVRRNLGDLAQRPIDAVTDRHIAAWIKTMEAEGLAPKTIANRHGFLAAMFADAARRHRLPGGSPCVGVRLPRVQSPEMTFLTPAEFATLLHYIPGHYQPLVATLAGTGLRWSEATALTVSDVDLEGETIRVSKAWKRAETGYRVGQPKTRRSVRTVGLSEQLVTLLEPLCDRDGAARLFTTPRGGVIHHGTFSTQVWRPSVRLANGEPADTEKAGRVVADLRRMTPATTPLGKRPRIHDLRHTAASWWLGTGIDIYTVSAMLGHESIKTTVDRYGHLQPEKRRIAAQAMTYAMTQALPTLAAATPERQQIES